MKEEFNLEQVLGKLASALNNNQYRDNFTDAIQKLVPFSANRDISDVVKSSVEIAVERSGAQGGLYLLHGLLDGMKQPQSDAALDLREWATMKWQNTLDAGIAEQPSNILSYLTSVAGRLKDEAHPLSQLLVDRWSTLFDLYMPTVTGDERSFELRSTLSLNDLTSNSFRKAVLGKLDALKDTDTEIVMKLVSEPFTRGGFYSFEDKDKESAKLLLTTLGYLVEKQKDTLKQETLEDLSWRVFVSSKDNPETAKSMGRIYLDLAANKADAQMSFDMYRSVFERKDLDAETLRVEAANKALDLVDAGKFAQHRRIEEIVSNVFSSFFYPSTQKETRNDKLAARAVNTLYPIVITQLGQTKGGISYQYFNAATALIDHLPKTDPRAAELVKEWKASVIANFKNGHDKGYYARQMGRMADIAAKKSDKALADFTRQEWLDTVETLAQKRPTEAHTLVREFVTNARFYNPKSMLLADAENMLPDLEKRAGIIRTPDEVSLADVKKIIAAKKQPKMTP